MTPSSTDVFALPDRLAAKASPESIAADERWFARIAANLETQAADLGARLADLCALPGRGGEAALERDLEIHRTSARIRLLQRFGVDLCLGRMVPADGGEPVYIGRAGLTGDDGEPLLVDWRARAAEPFFGATHGDPMGLSSRRRYRWTRGRITDYWDEVFTPGTGVDGLAPDDQSAFIASLGANRSPRMRDVLGTIQADQDAIIRAGSRGALVVDGGPGTGKTVVALHRAAYLLYSDPRLDARRGGVLFVGPSHAYLSYVDDVLPSLGEEGVRMATLRDLVEEGADAVPEHDPAVARLKSTASLVGAIETAVRGYEQPPTDELVVETPWAELYLSAGDWAEAFDAPEPGTAHNEARAEVWDALLGILLDQFDDDEVPPALVRRALEQHDELVRTFNRSWPLLDPVGVVADLWSVPAYLRRCAPWLSSSEVERLQRDDARAWTVADLPLLDAARRLIGDPEATARRRRRRLAAAAELEQRERVRDELIAADDSEMHLMSMLRGQDFTNTLADDVDEGPRSEPEVLAGPFAHVVVDEAQELTDAEWQMVLARCPSRSLTIVGDRAQARHGFTESWLERLERLGVPNGRLTALGVNYRTPEEVMEVAEPIIRAALPDANVPTSIRRSGVPVARGAVGELGIILERWLAAHPDGTACVIGAPHLASTPRVRSLSPEVSKGLEFDLVVLVDPDRFGEGIEGAVDRYVAMTRTTRELVVLTSG
ncbi:AAA family ATPase [Agromyces endophyticus]|uniref:RNA polymerase recycling motor ATPase HelR n=1 Tax=Agromyces sp. H17E-10 TaxID=2932244 RepID=UPI001FD2F82D|nr:RNA polymerase recycling motor ATPase HelR [Agromyces sp. H17E-10]UOQ89467.1 AAA family ATPase [Agromyces sp. H17E-10]